VEIAATEINDEFRWNLLRKNILERNAVRAFELFREARIEPLLIKGLAAGQYYPDSQPRVSVDLDLAVSDADFAKAEKIARSEAASDLAIDLHRELRHLDTVAWENLVANSTLLPLDGGSIRIPRPEDHLRIVCLHWLTDGGRDKMRLFDVYYAVINREPAFDWDRFFCEVSPTRQRWLECTLGLTAKYLGLDLTNTPAAGADEKLPRWLTDTVEKEWSAEVKFEPMKLPCWIERSSCTNSDAGSIQIQYGQRYRPKAALTHRRVCITRSQTHSAGSRIHSDESKAHLRADTLIRREN